MRQARCAFVAACLVVAGSSALRAEIYQWTDADGRVHFTQHLDRVPPAQRQAAQESARPQSRTEALEEVPSPAASDPTKSRAARLSRELRIPFERQGTLMLVQVRLNDSLMAPFYIDTGASGIALPPEFAQRLGIRMGPDTPHVMISTANGVVSRPVVRLDSVELGGARVEGLEATLNPSMDIGLLGGTFFNNFVYRVDAAEGVITLAPNDGIRAGLDRDAWRARFDYLRGLLERLETHLASEDLPDDERGRLERRRAELMAELAALDLEADRQRVPQTWRQ